MKIPTVLIYATFCFYANLTFAQVENNEKTIKSFRDGEMRNLIIHDLPRKLPEVEVSSKKGDTEVLNFDSQQVLLINFWATWCLPCREEMPSLSKIAEAIGSKNFSVIIIATGRQSNEKVKAFIDEHNLYNLRSYRDPKGKLASKLGVLGLPTTIIIDKGSMEVARLIGSTDWNSVSAISLIEYLLAGHSNK